MPKAPLKPCRSPGCVGTTREGRFCPEHGHLDEGRSFSNQEADRNRESAHKRGYGSRHRKLARVVRRLHPTCEAPGCTQPSEHADHIVSKARGGTDSLDNLQGLCASCHSKKTAWEQIQMSNEDWAYLETKDAAGKAVGALFAQLPAEIWRAEAEGRHPPEARPDVSAKHDLYPREAGAETPMTTGPDKVFEFDVPWARDDPEGARATARRGPWDASSL